MLVVIIIIKLETKFVITYFHNNNEILNNLIKR